ncbi:MAG: hypothetical protein AAF441_25185 [Pseudomonadota bacterium]
MSYLNFPQLNFFGKFRADPSTLNNTPDNFNPNNQFPPANGSETSNNIQLYWNPNGTAQFALDCTVTRATYSNGSVATSGDDDPIIGLDLVSADDTALGTGRVVDLDPMQQNVTEIWGLGVKIVGNSSSPYLEGAFKPSAYSNAWIQVAGGQGDYAGSANFQSVLEQVTMPASLDSRFLSELIEHGKDPSKLSINLVVRAFNSASQQYAITEFTLGAMAEKGVSEEAIKAITPLSELAQGAGGASGKNPGQIPTTSYFDKLISERLGPLKIPQSEIDIITQTAKLGAPTPLTEYDFTWGQVFGTIGLPGVPENATCVPGADFGPPPDLLTPDRILTPPEIQFTSGPIKVPTVAGPYPGYFAQFKVITYRDGPSGSEHTWVNLNLGNALLSTKPAGPTQSNVDAGKYGTLALYCFGNNKVLGKINYSDDGFYMTDAGMVSIELDDADVEAVQCQPLGLVTLDDKSGEPTGIILRENSQGLYVRPNQFVYRMNPGVEEPASGSGGGQHPADEVNAGTATVEFYVSQFGKPAAGVTLTVSPMPPLQAQTYSNNTLGTGGTTGMVNLSVPLSALILENGGEVTTDEHGIARLKITGTDPGNPRGYMDGQIYFLRYGFKDENLHKGYVQSADDLVSVQIYNPQPDLSQLSWNNFVGPILSQYGKIYPIMSFADLGDEDAVAGNAKNIRAALLRPKREGGHMPVTRDLSAGRLNLIVKWLNAQ